MPTTSNCAMLSTPVHKEQNSQKTFKVHTQSKENSKENSLSNSSIQKIKLPKESQKRTRSSPEIRRSKNAEQTKKQAKLDSYWLDNPSRSVNRFSVLETEEEEVEEVTQHAEKQPKPPPIFVDRVNNINPLINLLSSQVENNFELKVLNNEKVKIQAKTTESYVTIVKQLESKKTEFYTYKPKDERNFKAILRNMHSSVNTEDIKTALAEIGHKALNVFNMKHRESKKTTSSLHCRT
ncbi:uncharacterized protein LOC119675937 [Teleopsis dalmanni]|uniref:uncharacterized protein LOC119675937 n=1 Tax=Teleopsis dalmanni TaxID=139649 RepID=UPI0018CDC186|nr:uncharacterized protein LOC119675937 [Teleopsis dalmanni]